MNTLEFTSNLLIDKVTRFKINNPDKILDFLNQDFIKDILNINIPAQKKYNEEECEIVESSDEEPTQVNKYPVSDDRITTPDDEECEIVGSSDEGECCAASVITTRVEEREECYVFCHQTNVSTTRVNKYLANNDRITTPDDEEIKYVSDEDHLFGRIMDCDIITADYAISNVKLNKNTDFNKVIKSSIIKQYTTYVRELYKDIKQINDNKYYKLQNVYKEANKNHNPVINYVENVPNFYKKRKIFDYKSIKYNLRTFTDNLLKYIPLSDQVILSGGLLYDIATSNNQGKLFMDLDIFATKNVGPELVSTIIEKLVSSGKTCYAFNNGQLHYIFVKGSNRLIQVIYTDFESAEQIVNSFDASHVMMYYNGSDVFVKGICINGLIKNVSYLTLQKWNNKAILRHYKIIMRGLVPNIINGTSHDMFPQNYSNDDDEDDDNYLDINNYLDLIKINSVVQYEKKRNFFDIEDVDQLCELYKLRENNLGIFDNYNPKMFNTYLAKPVCDLSLNTKQELQIKYGTKPIRKHKDYPIYYPDITVKISGVISYVHGSYADDWYKNARIKPIYIYIDNENEYALEELESKLVEIAKKYHNDRKRKVKVDGILGSILGKDKNAAADGKIEIRVAVLAKDYNKYAKGSSITLTCKVVCSKVYDMCFSLQAKKLIFLE